jgi:hypothetical protein
MARHTTIPIPLSAGLCVWANDTLPKATPIHAVAPEVRQLLLQSHLEQYNDAYYQCAGDFGLKLAALTTESFRVIYLKHKNLEWMLGRCTFNCYIVGFQSVQP